jgi:protein-tyrosine phosphatase
LNDGLSATEATKAVLAKQGIDVSAHLSQKITKELIRRSDLILVMERMHEETVVRLAPEVKNRVFLLREFAKISVEDFNIADPIGRSLEFYEKTVEIIKEAVERVSNLI